MSFFSKMFFAFDGIVLPRSTFTINQHSSMYYLLISKIGVSELLHVTEPTHILRNGHCQTRTESPKIFENGIVNIRTDFINASIKGHLVYMFSRKMIIIIWIYFGSGVRTCGAHPFVERNLIYQLIIRSTLFHFSLHRRFQQQFATM